MRIVLEPLLRIGSTGPAVLTLQQALNLAGQSSQSRLKEDAQFGPKTSGRVVEFQRTKRLSPDGVVGPETRKALKVYFDMLKEYVDQIVSPADEAAARRRIVQVAEQCYLQYGWRSSDRIGPDNWRIAANRIARPSDDLQGIRQGGLALATIFSLAGVAKPAPHKLLTLTTKAESNYEKGLPGRNQWDIISWCGIFALYTCKCAGLRLSPWPLKIAPYATSPEFRQVTSAAEVKRGDIGICDFRPNRPNHHFIVTDVNDDLITSIEGNMMHEIAKQKYQTIIKQSSYRVSRIMQDPFSCFITPIWGNTL